MSERWNPFGIQARNFRKALARIFHSHLGKSREKPHEQRGANTCEGVVETTRHAGWETCDTAGGEACATTLGCWRVSARMVARLQRLMAIMASKPRALPWAVLWRPFRPCIRTAMLEEESHGFSLDGTAQGLRYGRLGSLRYKGGPWFCRFRYEISGLGPARASLWRRTAGGFRGQRKRRSQGLHSGRSGHRRVPWRPAPRCAGQSRGPPSWW